MTSSEMVENFFQWLELPPESPDEKGEYSLLFDGEITVNFLPKSKHELVVYSEVTQLLTYNENSIASLLEDALKLSLARAKTQRESLALDENKNTLILYMCVDTSTTGHEAFQVIIEKFVNNVEFWKNRIQGISQGSSPPMSVIFP